MKRKSPLPRRDLLKRLSGGLLAALVPVRVSFASFKKADIQVKMSPEGELMEAIQGEGAEAVRLQVLKRATKQGAHAAILLSQGKQRLLSISSDNNRKGDEKRPSESKIHILTRGVDYTISIEVEGEAAIDDRGLPVEPARVTVTFNKKTWQGRFDFKTWNVEGIEGAPNPVEVIPAEFRDKLEPFLPLIEDSMKPYVAKSEGTFSTTPGKPPGKTVKGKLCRAAAWGLSGAAAAACCALTAAAFCIAGAFVAAAAGSLASDACPD